MEDYKQYFLYLAKKIDYLTLDDRCYCELINREITINRNEQGQLHSKYLGNKYEPAVIVKSPYRIVKYYLFDGNIKDCEHPFRVSTHLNGDVYSVYYYSSERIKNNQPVFIGYKNDYNRYVYNECVYKILDEYPSGEDDEDLIKDFSILHEEMEDTIFKFKFAD